jgi:hypothetical protein
MRSWWLIAQSLSWLAVLAAPGQTFAQTALDRAPQEVIVEGRRNPQDAAHRFVDAVTVQREGQVAQFGEPVCPLVIGLPSAYNAAVAAEFKKDAKDAGVALRSSLCEPNVIVMIADDAHALLEKLHSARRPMFEGMDLHALQALLNEPGPIHVWHGFELLDEGGFPVGVKDPSVMSEDITMLSAPGASNYAPSRLQQSFRQRIDAAFIIIELKAIDGLTPVQIGDYAAMRTLAVTQTPGEHSGDRDSILSLFDTPQEEPKPASLSKRDAAYLHALYATSNGVSGAAQQANMAKSIERALSTPDAGEK